MSLFAPLASLITGKSTRKLRRPPPCRVRLVAEELERRELLSAGLPSPSGPAGVGVFDPSSARWYLRNETSSGGPDVSVLAYGAPGWLPLAGDWNADGVSSPGVFDPATATWYLKNSNAPGAADVVFRYGMPGWIPVVGDWDGNGTATVGMFDPWTATWYLRDSNSAGAPDVKPFQFGMPGWAPVTGDWNGDGRTTVGVVNPWNETWYLRNDNSAGAPQVWPFGYGGPFWRPLTGAWTAASPHGSTSAPGTAPGTPAGIAAGTPGGTAGTGTGGAAGTAAGASGGAGTGNPGGGGTPLTFSAAPPAPVNVPPSNLNLGLSAASLNENGSTTLSGSFADPNTADTHTVTIAWGDGQSTTLNLAAGVLAFSGGHQYLDNPASQPNGSYPISVTVTDAAGAQTSAGTSVQVKNVAPTASAGGLYIGSAGVAVSFSGTATDPSPADTAADLTYSWDFGDHTTGSGQSVGHTYAAAGPYTVTLTVTDKDGGATTVTTTASITAVSPVTSAYITTPYLTIPNFGASPTIVSVRSGNWSDPAVWSAGRVPAAGDIVDINPGTTVTYDVNDTGASAVLKTLEVQPTATLTFRTDVSTTLYVANLLVLQGGTLDIGTAAAPVAANVTAQVVIPNQALNTATDPEQYGNGLIALGNVTTYGAAKAPYVTLAQEAHAGDTALHLAAPAAGWQAGDRLQLPDTRQLDYGGDYGSYAPQWESLAVQALSPDGLTVSLAAPLQFSHLGARDARGALDFLPQVMDLTRNVSLRSQSPTGTRGYALFTGRADVDLHNTAFGGLGRTTDQPLDNTAFGAGGQVSHVGANEADRNPVTFLDLVGPASPQADGYQYTFAGNAVSCPLDPMPFIWGGHVANSFYGLIQDNVLSNWNGAGIAVDGTSSYNRLDGNFVMRVTGTSLRPDQALQGDAFWFGNPNNYVTGNIAADINGGGWDVFSYGYAIDMTGGMENSLADGDTSAVVPAYQGADPSQPGQSRTLNMNDAPILQFAGNTVYGATSSGATVWWIGTFGDTFYADARVSVVKDLVAWNIGTRAFYGYPTNNLVLDGLVVRGDTGYAANGYNYSQGVNFDDYMTHNLVIQNCDIQGMYTGIEAPFMVGRVAAMDTTLIQNCYLANTVNIELTPPRSVNGSSGLSPQTLDIANVRFAHPSAAPPSWWSDLALIAVASDSLGTSNYSIPQYVYVTGYNGVSGDNFEAYYTRNAPANAVTRQYIQGKVVAD